MSIYILKFFGKRDRTSKIAFWLFFIVLFLIHLWFAITLKRSDIIASFGGLLTVTSLLVSFTHSLYPSFQEDLSPPCRKENDIWTELPNIPGGFAITIDEQKALKLNEDHEKNIEKKYTKLVRTYFITILGTLIWAYAGYI